MRKTLLVLYLPAALVLLATAILSRTEDVPLSTFSRDPVSTLGGHPLTGVQSHLGVLLWVATAGICGFAATVGSRWRAFVVASGALTAFLALDDLFLFHEDLFYRYLGLGEQVVFALYAVLVAIYLVRFRPILVSRDSLLLVLTAVFFAASVTVDVLQDTWNSPWRIYFEDGFKLLGMVSWSGFLLRACRDALRA